MSQKDNSSSKYTVSAGSVLLGMGLIAGRSNHGQSRFVAHIKINDVRSNI